jgi:hypothetical protein
MFAPLPTGFSHSLPVLIFSTYSLWIASADRAAAEKVGAVLTAG